MVYFRFERQIGHHLIQTFAPSSLVVMLSWFSFWLDLDAIPGRVTLLVTCMLTLVTMFTGLRADIPPVAYVKVCLTQFLISIWSSSLNICKAYLMILSFYSSLSFSLSRTSNYMSLECFARILNNLKVFNYKK